MGVQSLGLRVEGSVSGVWGVGCVVWDVGFWVWGDWCGVEGLGFGVWSVWEITSSSPNAPNKHPVNPVTCSRVREFRLRG